MRNLRALLVALALVTTPFLSGCFWSIGGGEERTTIEHTRGEQLIDLKRALEAGAITPDEYESLRKAILEK